MSNMGEFLGDFGLQRFLERNFKISNHIGKD